MPVADIENKVITVNTIAVILLIALFFISYTSEQMMFVFVFHLFIRMALKKSYKKLPVLRNFINRQFTGFLTDITFTREFIQYKTSVCVSEALTGKGMKRPLYISAVL